ncbi:sensor domain-containing diguanylate cyclase [Halobacillus litoralis]|uniref:sensor domain-containing diguanylate cyclase n=1 Tax=Halobacillus litoralis TaxID=45668 RepID=UPI001CFD5243|nr:sensor domain-containing diguanylate cyclase [Halobacillus litoralis]
MSKEKKVVIWLLWAFVWPISMYGLYIWLDPVFAGNSVEIIAFIILASIVALFPLQIGDNPVFFTHGVAFAVFLYYGLFFEIVISQVAILALVAKVRLGRGSLYRVPINLLMFLFISVISALVYYALGGAHGEAATDHLTDVVPITCYALSQIILNQFSIPFISKVIYRKKQRWIDRGFIWDLLTAALVLPIGFVLYMVFSEYGISGIFSVGIPFVFISGMMMLYHNSNQVNAYLKETSQIGHELTGELGVKDVLDIFVQRIKDILPVDYIYIFDVSSDDHMELIRFFDRSGKIDFPSIHLGKKESVSGNTWEEEKSVYFKKRSEWSHLENAYTPLDAESVLSIPIERKNEIVGIITIYSNKRRAYFQFQFMILTILGNYLGVAIENARHYERTKAESERCALTGLYNYRYFEHYLRDLFDKVELEQQTGSISLVLLDIDHFKSVNDTYGHESGNEVLASLAKRLQDAIGKKGTLARYGGEEFVLLLPGYDEEMASHMAHHIRQCIIGEPFLSYEHILNQQGPAYISVTASIGVATYPDHCEEAFDLIRQADRAMYVGAKQKGRDRVAGYRELMKTV